MGSREEAHGRKRKVKQKAAERHREAAASSLWLANLVSSDVFLEADYLSIACK